MQHLIWGFYNEISLYNFLQLDYTSVMVQDKDTMILILGHTFFTGKKQHF